MFKKLLDFNNSKLSWGILLLGSSILLACSLSFQHILGLEPCVLCIYQRLSIMALIIAGFLPFFIGVKNSYIKYPSYFIWIGSSISGLWASALQWKESYLAAKALEDGSFFFAACGAGLEQYFPFIEKSEFLTNLFIAKGICSEIDWSFLGLEMHHYMVFLFTTFLFSGILFLIVNTIGLIKNDK